MPQVQFINTEAAQSPNRAEENLKTFFSNLSQEYGEKQAKDILDPIWEQYKNNENDAKNFRNTSIAIEKSGLSPTKRLQAQQRLNEIEKTITEREKVLNARTASAGKEYAKIREKSVANYVNDSISNGDAAVDQKLAIAEARKAVQGDIAGPGFKAAAKSNPYTQIIVGLTPDESALQTANKQLLSGTKGLFGSKPTEREIFLLLNSMLPSIGKTKEANEAGLAIIEKVNDMKVLRSEIVQRLTEGGSKYVDNLEQQVNNEMKPIAEALLEELKVVNEKFNPKDKKTKEKDNQIQVKAPDGSMWNMTQKQIDDAKIKGVIFEPVKK